MKANITNTVTKLVNDAIAAIPKARRRGWAEAINWADLRCVGVWWNDEEILAEVSEASPDCPKLSAYLEAAAMDSVERRVRVITSW